MTGQNSREKRLAQRKFDADNKYKYKNKLISDLNIYNSQFVGKNPGIRYPKGSYPIGTWPSDPIESERLIKLGAKHPFFMKKWNNGGIATTVESAAMLVTAGTFLPIIFGGLLGVRSCNRYNENFEHNLKHNVQTEFINTINANNKLNDIYPTNLYILKTINNSVGDTINTKDKQLIVRYINKLSADGYFKHAMQTINNAMSGRDSLDFRFNSPKEQENYLTYVLQKSLVTMVLDKNYNKYITELSGLSAVLSKYPGYKKYVQKIKWDSLGKFAIEKPVFKRIMSKTDHVVLKNKPVKIIKESRIFPRPRSNLARLK